MDDFDEDHLFHQDYLMHNIQIRHRFVRDRSNFIYTMDEFSFRRNFRFSKENIIRIVNLLDGRLQRDTRGGGVHTLHQVCLTLAQFASPGFQRTFAAMCGVGVSTATEIIGNVAEALCHLKPDWVHFRSNREMQAVAQKMNEKYFLPGFAFGVDGCQICFEAGRYILTK